MYDFVTGKAVDLGPLKIKTDNKLFKCKLSCCNTCSYHAWALSKERVKSRVRRLLSDRKEIKICQRCFLCHSIVLCKSCNKSTCRGQTSNLLKNLARRSGCRSKSSSNAEDSYTLPFRIQARLTRSPTVISCYVNHHRNLYLLEALHILRHQNAVEIVQK